MMNTVTKTFRWAALAATLISAPGLADDKRLDFDFDASVAAKYDSNVALVELDSNAGEPDTATVAQARIGTSAKLGGNFLLKAGYDFSATRYRDFAGFDLDLHHGHLSLTMRKGPTDSSIAIDRFEGVLSGDDYLAQTQVSPSISRIFGSRWYLRGALTRADKSYAVLEERDARSDAVRFDTYLLLDGMKHYVALGAQALSEDARNDEHDFDSAMAQLSWFYRAELSSMDIELKTQLRHEIRDYDAVILESGQPRADDRTRITLAATVPLSDYFSVGASVEHTSNASALAEANLERTVYAMKFGVAF